MYAVHSASLVVMISEDKKLSNVERYSGSTVRKTIQNDIIGQPLYSSDRYPKYTVRARTEISE